MTPKETFDYHLEALMEIMRKLEDDNAQLRQFQQSLHPTELSDYTKTYYVINSAQVNEATDYAIAIEGVCEKCSGVVDEVFRILGLEG